MQIVNNNKYKNAIYKLTTNNIVEYIKLYTKFYLYICVYYKLKY
jgi:hypothetical protein